MKNRKLSTFAIVLMMSVLLSLTDSPVFAAPLTPENAARRENHRKQKAQQITQPQRKAAAEALKAERTRIYTAKKSVRHTKPLKFNNK